MYIELLHTQLAPDINDRKIAVFQSTMYHTEIVNQLLSLFFDIKLIAAEI